MVLEDWISILENNLTLKLDTYNRMELLTLLKELKERRQLDIKSVNEEIDRFRANLAYEKTKRLFEDNAKKPAWQERGFTDENN